jgi:hypothetical protein
MAMALRRLAPILAIVLDVAPAATTPLADELAASGWQAVPLAPPAELVLDRLALPLLSTVAQLATSPATVPRPVLRSGEARLTLPLPASSSLLERDDSRGEPVLRWAVEVTARALAHGAHAILLDVPPLRPVEREGRAEPALGPQDPAARDAARRPLAPPRVRRDPARLPPTGELAAHPVVPPDPFRPLLRAAEAGGVDQDGLLVALEGGNRWVRLDLDHPNPRQPAHALGPEEVFVAPVKGHPGVLVAPRPLRFLSTLELFAIDPATLALTGIGSPAAREAPWSQSVTDVRAAPRGGLEALVVVRDAEGWAKREATGAADSWAARVVRDEASGDWTEVERLPLPGNDPTYAVRFDPADPAAATLAVGDTVVARRRLATAP